MPFLQYISEKLLLKLKNKYMISDFWLRDYLNNRKQFIDINGSFSETRYMLIGLVQGSVIGAPFFTYFINDLADVCQIAKTKIYVDDTNLVFCDYARYISKLKNDIDTELSNVNK
jgi:hypothetical protein